MAQRNGAFGRWLVVGDVGGDLRDDLIVGGYQAGEDTANVIFGRFNGLDADRNQLWRNDPFEIELNFKDDNLTELQQREVFTAAVRWSEVITGDLLDVYPWNGRNVDDLFIEVSARNIDGPGGTLAEARPTHWRKTHQPFAATMTIDTSDLGSPLPPPPPRSLPLPNPREGRDDYLPYSSLTAVDAADLTSESSPSLYDVALHEIGHAVGFDSTTLGRMGLIDDVPGATFIHFTGIAATAAYNHILGASATWTPMELDGSHWREATFGTGLMTPIADGRMELSPITVSALADMGYQVAPSAADVYPTGQAPRIDPIPLQSVPQGNELSLLVTVSSGTGLEYSLDQGPRGATIDPRSGLLRWTPSASQAPGIYAARVRVTSPSALTDTQGFIIEVLPATPPPTGAPVSLGVLNYGIAATDGRTGMGYVMYSEENLFTRFASSPPHFNNSEHLVAVVYLNGQWYYDNNTTLRAFTPRSSDVLLAEVDFTNDTVTSLEGISGQEFDITKGYLSGDLVFFADRWNGQPNDGEFQVEGTSFVRNSIGAAATMQGPPLLPLLQSDQGLAAEAVDRAVTDNAPRLQQLPFASEGVRLDLRLGADEEDDNDLEFAAFRNHAVGSLAACDELFEALAADRFAL